LACGGHFVAFATSWHTEAIWLALLRRKLKRPKISTTQSMIRAAVMLITAVAGIAVSIWVCSTLLDRRLTNSEIVVSGVSIAIVYWRVVAVRRRHTRKHLNSIRDSALW